MDTNKFEKKVRDTIKEYNLCSKDDKILVSCSGGKDSTTVLYLLNKSGYNVEGLIIDLLIGDWSRRNLENIKGFCKKNNIKLHVIGIREEFGGSICYIRSTIQSKSKLTNCSICGIIKRYLLNKKSREIGATKLATGHNLDDESENIMMNLFKGNLKLGLSLGPKTDKISDRKFVQRIRPLYFCSNEEIKEYSILMNFPVVYEPCPCSVNAFRKDIRNQLNKLNPIVKRNIVISFLDILPSLRECKNGKKIAYCRNCGEPSRNDVCRACQLIEILKS